MIGQFRINVEDWVLEDLRERLHRTRWPGELEAVGWELGTPQGYLRELCDYRQDEFDWRPGAAAQPVPALQG